MRHDVANDEWIDEETGHRVSSAAIASAQQRFVNVPNPAKGPGALITVDRMNITPDTYQAALLAGIADGQDYPRLYQQAFLQQSQLQTAAIQQFTKGAANSAITRTVVQPLRLDTDDIAWLRRRVSEICWRG